MNFFKNTATLCLKATEHKLFFFIAHVQGVVFHYVVGEQEWVQRRYLSNPEI